MMSRHVLFRWVPAVGMLLALLALTMGAVAYAAGSATIRDDAGLFTATGRTRIEQAAEQNNVRVVVITNSQKFAAKSAWRAWLRSQATDPDAITIGLHSAPGQKDVYVVVGANTGLSQAQAQQGVAQALGTFNGSGPAEGVIQLIQVYHGMGATAPSGSAAPSGGFGWGWLVPVIIVVLLALVLLRILGGRRRMMPGYGPGPYNQYGGPYQGYGGGGGFGRGLLGGVLGGLGGAWLGNQIFGDRNRDAGAADPNAYQGGPLDTPQAQSTPGEWTGDGGSSQADAGGWSGDAGGGWSGGNGGGGDAGGGWGGGDAGGGWGGDSGGGGGDSGGWS